MKYDSVHQYLQLPDFALGGKRLVPLRKSMILEAVSWDAGSSEEEKKYKVIYSIDKYSIQLGKPGKEVFRENNPNKNDMTPTLLHHDKPHEDKFSFDSIFNAFDNFGHQSQEALKLVGAIIFRMAYLLDHKDIGDGYRLELPKQLQDMLTDMPPLSGINPIAYLFMLESIALNEDVKYWTLGKNDTFKESVGRINNLLTYCHVIAFLLKKVSFAKIAGSFGRTPSGVSTITQTLAKECFPLLKSQDLFE